MKTRSVVTMAFLLSLTAGVSQAGGDAEAGKARSAACAGCHGVDGNRVNPEWPNLAGQHPGYIAQQLSYFEDGTRENTTMAPMAQGLSQQDRDNLAAYYAGQKVKTGTADPELVEQGKGIYRGGIASKGVAACMACHGPAGKGNPGANYPALGGQHAAYIVGQMKGFAAGNRKNEAAIKIMKPIAERMTDEETRAVATYIQGLF